MNRVRVTLLGAGGVILLLPSFAAASHRRAVPPVEMPVANGADLSVEIDLQGARPRADEVFVAVITIRNDGPDTATDVEFSTGETDQFDAKALVCGGELGAGEFCSFDELAPGEEVTAYLVLEVCCFVEGESRRGRITAEVASQTTDPDPDDNIDRVEVQIVGPPER